MHRNCTALPILPQLATDWCSRTRQALSCSLWNGCHALSSGLRRLFGCSRTCPVVGPRHVSIT
jgi:hypothetical protein